MFKRSELSGDYDHYWSGDPAFDKASDDFNYEAWLDTHDMAHLPCLEGQHPTRFVMRRLTEWERDAIGHFARTHSDDPNRQFQLLVRGALRKICDAFGPDEHWIPGRVKIEGVDCVEDGVFTELLSKKDLLVEMIDHIQRREFGSPRD